MKLPVIKQLVESASLAELKAAEEALYAEENLPIEVKGDDEGERLTHVLAAIYIKESMQNDGLDMATALRNYAQRVRASIS